MLSCAIVDAPSAVSCPVAAVAVDPPSAIAPAALSAEYDYVTLRWLLLCSVADCIDSKLCFAAEQQQRGDFQRHWSRTTAAAGGL